MNWYVGVLKKYADFSGRARRKEYWMFFLFNFIFSEVLALPYYLGIFFHNEAAVITGLILSMLYSLGIFVPSLAVAVRRLHDIGWSGLYLLLCLIPLVGVIILLVKYCTTGTPGLNTWGANPKEVFAKPQSQ